MTNDIFERVAISYCNKLSAEEKIDYKELKKRYKPQFQQCEDSGITICRVIHEGGNFDKVAISYCSQFDKFNKKRGKFEALLRIHHEQFVLIPRFAGRQYEAILEML